MHRKYNSWGLDDNFQIFTSGLSSSDKLKQIPTARLKPLFRDNFHYTIFKDNPMIEVVLFYSKNYINIYIYFFLIKIGNQENGS